MTLLPCLPNGPRRIVPTTAIAAVLSVLLPGALSCDHALESDNQTGVSSELTSPACTSSTVKVLDLHADFRDIWKGRETADTGKQADPDLKVGVDFNTTVQPARVSAQFLPVKTDGTCGAAVPSAPASALIASQVWGTSTSDAARAPLPEAFNVLVRDSITGIVSAGGPIAAGGDVTLSSMSLNGTVRQPVGLIGGGKVTLSSGSVSGNLTYGAPSTIPQTVSVSGTKTLLPFATTAAFQDLASLAILLAEEAPTGTSTTTGGTLQMTGSSTALNVFQVSADALSQATFVQLTVPANAGAIINVTGNMSVSLQNKGISLQGATASTLLWNIPAAAFVQISGVSLQGSILAPRSLVTFDSGNLNGTLVAAAFASSGSGSLQYAALNVSKLFGPATPSLVRLAPAQPLVRGCAYQFVIPGTVPLTAAGACLSPPINVTFRVSGSSVPPGGRELTRVEPDPVLHTLRRFTARPGINTLVDDVWARYEGAIGISVSNLVPTTVSVPSSTIPGQMVTVYQQYAQGYPVVGFGYFVASEGGLFRAANGKVAPGLPAFPPAAVSASTALQSSLAFLKITQAPWVGKPSVYHAPVGRLVVMPKRTYPTGADFALAWDFQFGGGTGIFATAGIDVDAATGAVIGADSGLENITTLNAQATYTGNQLATTVDSIYDGNARPFKVASYQNPDQTMVTTLASGDIKGASVLATVTGTSEDAQAAIVGTPQFIVDPTPLTPWVATDKVEQRMATLQWGLELSNTFMQSLNLRIAGVPWLNIDGPTAHQKVLLNYVNGPSLPQISPVHYTPASTPDAAQIFVYLDPRAMAFQANSIAHEYTHALIDSLRRASGLGGATGIGTLANYKEAGSLNEGIADLFAISMNHLGQSSRSLPWYCMELDRGKGPECLRNIAHPELSTDDPLGTGQAGLPPLYKDVLLGYHDFTNDPVSNCNAATDGCGVHLNSTIISHWGYILGVGIASSGNACRLTVEPLDPDPDKSLRMALNIALIAVSTKDGLTSGGLIKEATFADFRDATLQVADELVNAGVIPPEAVAKIELAWAAVGLPPLASHSDVAAPADVSGAYPWANFVWPLTGDGQSGSGGAWDFQLTNSSFDTSLAFHQDGITGVGPDNLTGVLPLTLPYSSTDTFSWRVRPHSNLPWEICYPIHSFVGTTVPDPVKDLQVTAKLASIAGLVLPGPFDVSWDFIRGTATPGYDLMIGTRNARCAPADDITPISVDGLSTDGVTESDSVGFVSQPKTHYFMNVLPVGPPTFAGTPALGDCATLEFDTADLLPPDTAAIADPQILKTSWRQVFQWKTSGGAVKSLVTLYARDSNGVCAADPIGPSFEITTNCTDSCSLDLNTPPFNGLPNPAGYCWDVVDVAANGLKSPPTRKELGFRAFTVGQSPGLANGVLVASFGSVGILPGDSYGQPVSFSWTTLPNFPSAPAYGFKLGRWQWPERLPGPDPANCVALGNEEVGSCVSVPPTPTVPRHFDCSGLSLVPSTLCLWDPTADTKISATVRDGTATLNLSAEQAGKGRYCWATWPIFDDPQNPGQALVQQPQVSFDLACYTTGPAPPRIVVPPGTGYSTDPNTPPTGFPQQPITGEIQLDYVPQGQMKITVSPGVTLGPPCQADPNGAPFQDYYDCKIPFTIDPLPSSTYSIEVDTFNSDQSIPVMDDSTRSPPVPPVTTISTGACGGRGQACCGSNACDEGVCNNNKCADSIVTIVSPADNTIVPTSGEILSIRWTDPNPPATYHVSVTSPFLTTTNGNEFDVPAEGTAATIQQFQIFPQFILIENQSPFLVRVCAVLSHGRLGSCDQRSINTPKPPPPPPPPPACSPPVVPSVPQCEGPFDTVSVDFKLVSGGLTYDVEYTRPDMFTYTKSFDASNVFSDFNVDSAGNFISSPVWYSPDEFEPAFGGVWSFRVRVRTSNCQSDFSPPSFVDTTGSASCQLQGFCAELICRYVAPPN